jgi:hypothetical protein
MINEAFWQFQCPECGFGDREHGHLLTAHESIVWFVVKKTLASFVSVDGRSSKSRNSPLKPACALASEPAWQRRALFSASLPTAPLRA